MLNDRLASDRMSCKAAPRRWSARGHDTGRLVPMQDKSIPRGLCQCGCGQKTPLATRTRTARGIVAGEPTRFVHGHTGRTRPTLTEAPLCACGCGASLPIRWASEQPRYVKGHDKRGTTLTYDRVDCGFKTPCWIWNGIGSQGYGVVNTVEHRGNAHILMYIRKFGSVPGGRELHHLCEVRACVNPDHLQPLTRCEHRRLRRDNKLSVPKAIDIRTLAKMGVTQREIARRFGITQSTVWAVIHRKAWDAGG